MTLIIILVSLALLVGGFFLLIGASMSDVRGDSGGGFWPLVAMVVGLIGLGYEIYRGAAALLGWLA